MVKGDFSSLRLVRFSNLRLFYADITQWRDYDGKSGVYAGNLALILILTWTKCTFCPTRNCASVAQFRIAITPEHHNAGIWVKRSRFSRFRVGSIHTHQKKRLTNPILSVLNAPDKAKLRQCYLKLPVCSRKPTRSTNRIFRIFTPRSTKIRQNSDFPAKFRRVSMNSRGVWACKKGRGYKGDFRATGSSLIKNFKIKI